MKLLRVMLLAVLTCTLWACTKEKSADRPSKPSSGSGGNKTVVAGIQGRIFDEYAVPLAGARVECGSKTTVTDANGTFLLLDVKADADAAVVTVSKEQYMPAARTLILNERSLHYVQLILYDKNAVATFNSATGGTVQLPGCKMSVPADAIQKENNTTYNGIVEVNYRYINPENNKFADYMAGDLRGLNKSGSEKGLKSYGMLTTTLTGENGESLHLNKAVDMQIDIPGTLESSAPQDISLWRYDTVSGFWKEEILGSKQNDHYNATVKDIGFWHCATSYDLVDFTTTVVDQHGAPVSNMLITVFTKLDFVPVYSYTDASGRFTGRVPANQQLVFTLTDPCKDLFSRQEIGPFSKASTIPMLPVSLPESNLLIIDGKASNCTDQLVQKGSVDIIADGLHYITRITTGKFAMNILRCSNTVTNLTFNATDSTTKQSTITTINTGNGSITPTLVVCP